MSATHARRLGWAVVVLTLALQLGGKALYATTDAFELTAVDLLLPLNTTAFSIVGALVASRHPDNAIGWIFLGAAASGALGDLAFGFVEYSVQADGDPGTLAGAAAVYHEYAFLGFVIVPVVFLVLLFPTGRLLSRRWRAIAWCGGAGILGALVTGAMLDPLSDYPTVDNPFAVDNPVVDPLSYVCLLAMYVAFFGAVRSIVVRFRRAGHEQRQQIKWFATAGVILAVILPIDDLLSGVTGSAAYAVSSLALLGLPVAVGIAILRHRLYDIDVVINRALVYGALTATLAGAYLGGVLLLQLALSPLTESNSLAIAASTLAVAALFQPARRRIQSTVDRRFYRRKYDAARTLEQFGARLRDEVDLDALGGDLRGVVTETMQPRHVSLWLRKR